MQTIPEKMGCIHPSPLRGQYQIKLNNYHYHYQYYSYFYYCTVREGPVLSVLFFMIAIDAITKSANESLMNKILGADNLVPISQKNKFERKVIEVEKSV